MKGLLIKDLEMIQASGKSSLMLVVLALGALALMEEVYFPGILMIIVAYMWTILALNTVYIDMTHDSLSYLFTLPIGRRMYVSGKFLLGLVPVVVVNLILLLVFLLMRQDGLVLMGYGGLSVVLSALLLALEIPLYLFVGAGRIQLVGVVAFLVAAFVIGGFSALDPSQWVVLQSLPLWLYLLAGLLAVLAVLLLSWAGTIRILRRKEL